MRYQTALRPVRRCVRYTPKRQGARTLAPVQLSKIVARTLSPVWMPNSRTRPAFISSTARTGSGDEIGVVDNGMVLDAIVAIVPSGRMNNMSNGRIVFFIQNDNDVAL